MLKEINPHGQGLSLSVQKNPNMKIVPPAESSCCLACLQKAKVSQVDSSGLFKV